MLPGSSCPNAPPSSANISAKLARQQYFLLSSPDTILWANFLIHLDWIWTNDNCHCAGGKLQTAGAVVPPRKVPDPTPRALFTKRRQILMNQELSLCCTDVQGAPIGCRSLRHNVSESQPAERLLTVAARASRRCRPSAIHKSS